MPIEAQVILDSINPQGSRLVTMLTRYPKFIHAEHCRHRSFSFSVSSSRAIPVTKNLEEVRFDTLRAGPIYWGAEQKGMAAGVELSDEVPEGEIWSPREQAQMCWDRAAQSAVMWADEMVRWGVHKSIVNRVLEPFLHVNVLVTGTTDGWMNFFGLRLDAYAQPEIRALAEKQWALWNESKPKLLKPGDWHTPFVDFERSPRYETDPVSGDYRINDEIRGQDLALKVSTARCARLSYQSFETGRRSTIEEDLALYDRLITSRPIHASPAEHQATPDRSDGYFHHEGNPDCWERPGFGGNLGPGWIQHRKTLPNEAVAELPESYR